MTPLRTAAGALLVALAATASAQPSAVQAAPAETAAADSLLDQFIASVGYDRFIERGFTADLTLPGGLPNAQGVRRTWESFYTLPWLQRRIRTVFLAQSSPEEVQAILEWSADPVVRRAIAVDYASIDAPPPDGDPAALVAAMDPRLVAAARRVSRAAGDGLPWVQDEADREVLLVRYALGDEMTPEIDAQLRQAAARGVQAFRAEGVEFMRQMVAVRFASFPPEDMERYAVALESEAGQAYLRLVVDSAIVAMRDALEIALGKAQK